MAWRAPKHKPHPAVKRPDTRPSASRRGYGHQWQKLRVVVLAEEPLCRTCRKEGRLVPATDVDHIVPREQGGTDERSNLQPLCHPHHSQKTATEDGGFGRARK